MQCNNVSIIFLALDTKSEEMEVKEEEEAISSETQKVEEVSTTQNKNIS